MPIIYGSLNNASFNELDSSLLLTIGDGLTHTGGTYVASPNGIGLATYDNWLGALGSPAPSDIVSYNTVIPGGGIGGTLGVIQYTFTTADGTVSPHTGGVGAEIVGWNATGVLLEQLTGYVPGSNPTITPDGSFLILANPIVDLSVTDGSGGATLAERTFSTTGPFPNIPEPSTVLLMPLLVVALMVARIPAVRSFLGGRRSFIGAR